MAQSCATKRRYSEPLRGINKQVDQIQLQLEPQEVTEEHLLSRPLFVKKNATREQKRRSLAYIAAAVGLPKPWWPMSTRQAGPRKLALVPALVEHLKEINGAGPDVSNKTLRFKEGTVLRLPFSQRDVLNNLEGATDMQITDLAETLCCSPRGNISLRQTCLNVIRRYQTKRLNNVEILFSNFDRLPLHPIGHAVLHDGPLDTLVEREHYVLQDRVRVAMESSDDNSESGISSQEAPLPQRNPVDFDIVSVDADDQAPNVGERL